MEAPALNPTGGVTVKPPVMLDYKKDPTRPGGGVFVAAAGKKGEFHDVPVGTIISGSSEDGGGEGSAASDSEGEVASLVAARAAAAAGANVSLPAANYNDRATNHLLYSPSPFAPTSLPASTSAYYPDMRTSAPVSAMRGNAAGHNAEQSQGMPLVNFTVLTGGSGARGGAMNVNPAMNVQQNQDAGNVQVMNTLDGAQGSAGLAQLANADGFLEGIPGGMFDWGKSGFLIYVCAEVHGF